MRKLGTAGSQRGLSWGQRGAGRVPEPGHPAAPDPGPILQDREMKGGQRQALLGTREGPDLPGAPGPSLLSPQNRPQPQPPPSQRPLPLPLQSWAAGRRDTATCAFISVISKFSWSTGENGPRLQIGWAVELGFPGTQVWVLGAHASDRLVQRRRKEKHVSFSAGLQMPPFSLPHYASLSNVYIFRPLGRKDCGFLQE